MAATFTIPCNCVNLGLRITASADCRSLAGMRADKISYVVDDVESRLPTEFLPGFGGIVGRLLAAGISSNDLHWGPECVCDLQDGITIIHSSRLAAALPRLTG